MIFQTTQKLCFDSLDLPIICIQLGQKAVSQIKLKILEIANEEPEKMS